MRRTLAVLAILLIACPAPAAITDFVFAERYVCPVGQGADNGMTAAGCYDLAAALADQATGRSFNFAGTFEPTTFTAWSTNGTLASPIRFRGWTTGFAALCTDMTDMPIFDGTNMDANDMWYNYAYQSTSFMRFRNGTQWGIGTAADNDHGNYHGLWIHDNGGGGMALDDNNQVSDCLITGNTGIGLQGDLDLAVVNSMIYDNTLAQVTVDDSAVISGTYLGGGTHGVEGSGSSSLNVIFSTIDGASTAGIITAGVEGIAFGNQITNCEIGVMVPDNDQITLVRNNFFGNTTDVNWGQGAHGNIGSTFVDPEYVGIGTNDYTIGNADLVGVGASVSMTIGTVNIGAWQNSRAVEGVAGHILGGGL